MTTETPYIFLSHSRKNTVLLEEFVKALTEAGYKVWVDTEDIAAGSRWVREIKKAVDGCAAMVVLLTTESAESKWVERETLRADEIDKPLLVARLDDAEIPFWLTNVQALDFRKDHTAGFARLIKQLGKIPTLANPEKVAAKPPTRKPKAHKDHAFFKYLKKLPDGDICQSVALDLLAWAEANVDDVNFSGTKEPAMQAVMWVGSGGLTVFSVRAYSKQPSVEIPLQYVQSFAPYDQPAERARLLRKLNYLMPPGEEFDEERADRRPNLPIARALGTPDNLNDFKAIVGEIIEKLRANITSSDA
ncbi:MAG: toll/interleukin-1 receptor domain-containing protein [Anaerolineae bacterium]